MRNRVKSMTWLKTDQRGITGLETAIVLIAFVVVASVFAFAVLSTGLLSSEKSKETVLGGLEETQSTIVLRGSVIAHASTTIDRVDKLTFQISNATQGAEAVDLSSTAVVVSYFDDDQVQNSLPNTANASTTPGTMGWHANWLQGSGPLLDADERVELHVNINSLATALTTSTQFRIEVKPQVGATLVVERTTAAELKAINNLN